MDLRYLEAQPITPGLLRTVRLLGEYKGKQDLFKEQAPRLLETLREVAVIQSIESSNRLEGVVAPHERIVELARERTTPRNRSEQEIAGYREVLNTIHANHANIPFTVNVLLQFHRDLYQFMPGEGGRWKATNNDIVETRPNGTEVIRFRPVPAHLTPGAMDELHDRFNRVWEDDAVDRLLLIPTYVLDFLCIHPFRDGNGRMARLLTLLLLYRAGYEVGRYVSLEQIVESTREGYYDTLYLSSQGWHEGAHRLLPWWEYFLGVMLLSAYREFEHRAGLVQAPRGAKRQMVLDAVTHLPGHFQYADVERACPGVSRPTINRVLAELRREGRIQCIKPGRDAVWEKHRDHER
jgi:Fic family protein